MVFRRLRLQRTSRLKVRQLAGASLWISGTRAILTWVAGSERRELPGTLRASAAMNRIGGESRINRAAAPSPRGVGAAARLSREFAVNSYGTFKSSRGCAWLAPL